MALTNSQAQQVYEHLLQQLEIYDHAMPIAERLAQRYEASPAQQAELAQLDVWMQEASSVNRRMQELMPDGPESAELSHEIKVTARQLGRQISRMLNLFDAMEKQAQRIKTTLAPQLDESLRARQMKAAYSNRDFG
ncbi:MAG: hypothetical protein ACR2NP_12425 [Pirellulaceae bacterium]